MEITNEEQYQVAKAELVEVEQRIFSINSDDPLGKSFFDVDNNLLRLKLGRELTRYENANQNP